MSDISARLRAVPSHWAIRATVCASEALRQGVCVGVYSLATGMGYDSRPHEAQEVRSEPFRAAPTPTRARAAPISVVHTPYCLVLSPPARALSFRAVSYTHL